ncbi:xanthine permease [Aequitasia blattaphilus]|uniref:Purine permease n=1 Tax=Aequitasia blattaphilus TaxID=2949332 RepID=A0ABT1E979_9FIRM|nr:nucleobase:cation symporter-2 family protein [Aequitasia blattaphilus]MCP1102394.1 purine permease [Aequitasia blattaphilus]MCR8615034.1 purine permease [Aequitasia blattaphilus]
MNKQKQYASVFELNGTPKFGEAFPLALQHVIAMIVGCVTPSIIIASVAGLSDGDRIILIQAGMTMSALTTFLQLFPIGKKNGFRLGSGLPMIMGISFAYLPSMQAIAEGSSISSIFGAMIVGGVIAVIVGLFMQKIQILFPPLIAGTVVFTIGLSLYPTAVRYIAGGSDTAVPFGSWQNWLIGLITLAVVTTLNHFGKGFLKLASILIGMGVGYVIALCMGMIDFSGIAAAGLFQLPQFMHFGITFEPSSCIALGLLFAINSIQAIGDFSATTSGGMDRQPTGKELQNGVVGYGLCNIISPFFGGLPTATYSQNVGIVATTKVINRGVFGLAGGLILIAGLVPKFSAALTTIPSCVLGGATISVFASIAMTGIKLITQEELSYRNTSIVGLSVALGMGVTQVVGCFGEFPTWVTTVFGKSPTVLATIAAIILNQVLPKTAPNEALNE